MWSFGIVMFIMLFGFPPFHGSSDDIIKKQIKQGFHPIIKDGYGPWFPKNIEISQQAKDLISKLLILDPAIRLSASEALEHDFFHHQHVHQIPLHHVVDNLKKFTAKNQFKTLLLQCMTNSLQEIELKQLHFQFQLADKNKDGKLSSIEINEIVKKITKDHYATHSNHLNQMLFNLMDINDDGFIDYQELIMHAVQQKLIAKEDRLYNTFRQLDLDHNGLISKDEIISVLGDDIKNIDIMIAEIDINQDGLIDYDEFTQVFVKKSRNNLPLKIDLNNIQPIDPSLK